MPTELQDVHGKFEVDQPAGAELHVQVAARRLVALHVGPHLRRVADELRRIAGEPQDLVDDRSRALLRFGRSEHRPRSAQRHMLPRPGALALVVLERVERDDKHPLGALGPQAHIDVVERAGGGRHAERGGDPAAEPVEIIVGAERLCSVRPRARLGRMQIDDVEVRSMGERAAAEPPQAEHDQPGAGNSAVDILELAKRGLAERQDRALGDARIAVRHLQRIAM